jgi:hypothetical protein
VAVSIAWLGLAALHPAPLVLGLALVVFFSIPWAIAVLYRLRHEETPEEQAEST